MLVLTRKPNEAIVIDGEIEIMVVHVRGNRVGLGFRAPSSVSIQRKERAPRSDVRRRAARQDEVSAPIGGK